MASREEVTRLRGLTFSLSKFINFYRHGYREIASLFGRNNEPLSSVFVTGTKCVSSHQNTFWHFHISTSFWVTSSTSWEKIPNGCFKCNTYILPACRISSVNRSGWRTPPSTHFLLSMVFNLSYILQSLKTYYMAAIAFEWIKNTERKGPLDWDEPPSV